jgi:hypothetical protein
MTEQKTARIYKNCWRGKKISEYGLQYGYIDYKCLADIVGSRILNFELIKYEVDYWELYSGIDYNEENDDYYEIFQYYIISDNAAEFLAEYTDEIVYYNSQLDVYLWGITHWGTGWDYVLTDIKIDADYYGGNNND